MARMRNFLHPRIAVNAIRDGKFREYIAGEEDPAAIEAAQRGIDAYWDYVEEQEEMRAAELLAGVEEQEAADRAAAQEAQDEYLNAQVDEWHEERMAEMGQASYGPALPEHGPAPAEKTPAEMGADYYTQPVGSDRHRAAHREFLEAHGGPMEGWTPEQEYAADNWAELEYDRWQRVQEEMQAGEPGWIPAPVGGTSPEAWDRYVKSEPGSDEHKSAYVDMHREAEGEGFPSPDPDQSYLVDHEYETDADRFRMPDPEIRESPESPKVSEADQNQRLP